MHGPWRWRRTTALLIATLAAAAPARAQLLKLTGDVPPPAAGTGAEVLAIADALDRSIPEVRARGKGPGVDAAAGLRRIARDLAREGEKAGAAGSFRIVAARTIANNLAAFDDLLIRGRVDPAVLEMVAANFSEDSPTAAKWTAAPAPELDRLLRDALAPLMDVTGLPAGPWGWVDDPPRPLDPGASAPLTPDVGAWSKLNGITPEAIAALKALDQTLAEADHWAAYRRSAATIRAEVRAAANAFPATDKPWLVAETKVQLVKDFSAAAVALGTAGADMDAPRAEGRRLALVGRVAAGVDRLPSDAQGKKVRTALSDFLRTRTPDRDAERRSLDAFDRAVTGILAREDFAESRTLVRQLRPAWKVLDKDCQTAEHAVTDVLPRLLQYESAVTDPAVLTAVASHRRALEDLESLYRTSATILRPPGAPATDAPAPAIPSRDTEPASGWKPVADRLLKIAQDLNKPDAHDAALEQFRAFASRLERFRSLPGEADLRSAAGRSAPPGWSAITANRAAELLTSIAAARESWLQKFAESGSAAESGRLELLEDLMAQVSAASAVAALVERAGTAGPGRGPGAFESWPGWEMSSQAHAALLAPARERFANATALTLEGSDAKAAEALADTRKSFPAVLLIGRLERSAADFGLGSGAGAPGAISELACGSPLSTEAWLIPFREDLAQTCRYAEEYSSPLLPQNPSDPAATPETLRKAFIDFANSRAARVLGELDRVDHR